MMLMEIINREYKEGDERGIFELYSRMNPQKAIDYDLWYAKWKWQYQESPYGKSRIWLAIDDGKIVGQYPTMYWKMKIHGDEVLSVQTVDLMTDPDIRSPGQFLKMGKLATDAFMNSDVRMMWALPNDNALGGHIRGGMRKLGQFSLMFRILNPLNHLLGEPDQDNRGNIPGNLVRVSQFDARCNSVVEEFSRSKDLTTVRRIDHLNWRYPDSFGFRKYYAMDDQNVEGYLVYRLVKYGGIRIGMLIDLVYRNDAVLRRLLKGFYRLCSRDHAPLAAFFSITNGTERKELLRAGLSNFVFYDKLVVYGMLLPEKSKTDPAQFKNIYLTYGDSDYKG